jgi:hypothetical protein
MPGPLTEIDGNARRLAQKPKSGPKPKAFAERSIMSDVTITDPKNFRSREKKLQVLTWMHQHRVYDSRPLFDQAYRTKEGQTVETTSDGGIMRPPTTKEAAQKFNIPEGTLKGWWKNREKILNSRKGCRSNREKVICEKWPTIESELFQCFTAAREKNLLINRYWIQRKALSIASKLCDDGDNDDAKFKASNSWFWGFCGRYSITRRRVTNQAQKTLENYQQFIDSWVQFIRRVSTPEDLRNLSHDSTWESLFHPSRILNMDETPIPFEFNEGYTYEYKGSKTVSGKTDRSGWGKRQATLCLYIFADGIGRIPPKLIFHGQSNGRLKANEQHLYDPRVTVEFNATAYNNGELFQRWIDEELVPCVDNGPSLLTMDHAKFHKTDSVLKALKTHAITTAIIPPACTSLLQPLDVSVNKPFKDYLREALGDLIEDWEDQKKDTRTPTSRRILTTMAVAMAWEKLCHKGQELVKNSFIYTGISIRPDGSEDHLIRIKDYPNPSFDGWRTRDEPIGMAIKLEESLTDEFDFDQNDVANRLALMYTTWVLTTLRKECKDRGLPVSGRKKDVVDRIVIHEMNRQQKYGTWDHPIEV